MGPYWYVMGAVMVLVKAEVGPVSEEDFFTAWYFIRVLLGGFYA